MLVAAVRPVSAVEAAERGVDAAVAAQAGGADVALGALFRHRADLLANSIILGPAGVIQPGLALFPGESIAIPPRNKRFCVIALPTPRAWGRRA